MRRLFNNVVSVLYTMIRMFILKLIRGGDLQFAPVERFSPNVVFEMNKGAKVTLEKGVRVHSGTKIKVRKNAKLFMGADSKINYNCIIACHDSVSIGEGTEFGPSVYLYDHDHDYKAGLNSVSEKESYKSAPIVIGKNCWIGANTVILRGTVLGDNCVVGAGCVLNGGYEANSLIVQKRQTTVKNISVE